MNPKLRPLGWAAYAVAALLVVMPLTDTFLGVWPMRVGQVTWRFGAAGLLSRALMTPLFGLLIGLVTATLLEHRIMTRVLSIVAFLGALLGVLAMVMFGLDALQARSGVRPEALTAFDTAWIVALIKYFLGTITAILLGVGGWKAARHRSRRTARPGTAESPAEKDSERVLISAEDR